MARAGCDCSCRGSLWADGNGESFISPHCQGEGVGRGRPRKFSFCHHRTKIRMSTTSKMMKRTTIAHHCRRSGKKRKHQSSCFSGEGKLGEHFSSCTARNQIQAQAIKSLNKFLWEEGCGAVYCSEAFSCRTHWGLGTAVGILRLLPNQVQTALKSWLKSNWEEQAESCCVCCSFMERSVCQRNKKGSGESCREELCQEEIVAASLRTGPGIRFPWTSLHITGLMLHHL